MKSIILTIALAALLAFSTNAAETYKIDPVHSSVAFSVVHLGVTNFYGAFKEVTGTVVFDPADPAKTSVDISVPVESIDTRNQKRDQHLKSPDFFDVQKFPTMTFKSTKVEGSGNNFKVTGDFTLHGVTKPLTVEFKRGPEGKGMQGEVRGGGETRFTIKRSDFGMTFMANALADEINIVLSLEGVKQ